MGETAAVLLIAVALGAGIFWGTWIGWHIKPAPLLKPGYPLEFRFSHLGTEVHTLYVASIDYSSRDGVSAYLTDGSEWRAEA